MSSDDARGDEAFRRILSELKPYAKHLPKKSDVRQRVTLWVKKLLSATDQKQLRCAYAKLLLQALSEGSGGGLLRENPPRGPLEPLASSRKAATAMHYRNTRQADQHVSVAANNTVRMTPNRSRLLQPGWARHSPPRKQHRTSPHTSPAVSSHEWLGGRASHQGEEHSVCSEQESAPSLRGLSLEDLINVSGVYVHNKTEAKVSHQNNHPHYPSRTVSFDLDSSLEDLREDFMHSPSLSVSDGGDDSDVTDLLQGNSSHSLVEDQELLQLLEAQSAPSPVRHMQRTPARQPSWSGGNHSNSLYSSNAPVSGTYNRYQMTTGVTSSYVPEWKSPTKRTSPLQSSSLQQARPQSKDGHQSDAQFRMAEAKFSQEKAKMQQKLEQTIRKLLDKKNNELEDLKSTHHVEVHKLESKIKTLERQVHLLEQECSHVQEERQRKEKDLQLSSQHLKFEMQTELQQKLQEMREKCDQQIVEMQQKHGRQVHRASEEASARLKGLEKDYQSQLKTTSDIIQELEVRVAELSKSDEMREDAYSRMAKEKVTLEQTLEATEGELHTVKERMEQLEGDYSSLEKEKSFLLEGQEKRAEEAIQQLKKQLRLQENKWRQHLSEAEKKATSARNEKEETERKHRSEMAEAATAHKRRMQDEKQKHHQKLQSLHREMELQGEEASRRQQKLEDTIRECRSQLEELQSSQKAQVLQAERALEDYRTQSEASTNTMFSQMRREIESLEKELAKVRSQKEQQVSEMTKQYEERQRRRDKELEQQKAQHERELAQAKREHQWEMERRQMEYKQEKEELSKVLSQQLEQKESQWKERTHAHKQAVESLEGQVRSLSDQLHEGRALSQKEMAEARVRWEEDRLDLLKYQETAVSKLKAQCEQERTQLVQTHTREIQAAKERAGSQLKQLEAEYGARVAQVSESMSALRQQVTTLEEELNRQQQTHESHLSEVEAHNREEVQSMKTHHEALVKALQHESESAQRSVRKLEEQLQESRLQLAEKLSQVKLQYETRMRSLMPQSIQKDYESTIASLRDQVQIANQRATLLQQELNQRLQHPLSPRHSHTHSPSLVHTPTRKFNLSNSYDHT